MAPLKGVFHSFMGTSRVASSDLARSQWDSFFLSFVRSMRGDNQQIRSVNRGSLNLPGVAFGRDHGGRHSHPQKDPPFETVSFFSSDFQTVTVPSDPSPTTSSTDNPDQTSPGSGAGPTDIPTSPPNPISLTVSSTSTGLQAPPHFPTPQPPPPSPSPAAVTGVPPPPGTTSGAPQNTDGDDGDGISGLPSSSGPGLPSQTSPLGTGSAAADESAPTGQTATIASNPVVTTSAVVFTSDGQTLTSFSTFTADQALTSAASLPTGSSSSAAFSSASTVHARMVMGGAIATVLFCLIAGIIAFIFFRHRKRRSVNFLVVKPTTPRDHETLQEIQPPAMTQPFDSPRRSVTFRRKPVPQLTISGPGAVPRHVEAHLPDPESDLAEADPFEDQNPFDDPVRPPVGNRLSIMSVIPLDGPVSNQSITGYAV